MNLHISRRRMITSLVGAMALPSMARMAQAQEPATTAETPDVLISLRPKDKADGERFTADIEAGSSMELVAVLQNFGAEAIELRTFTSDVVPVANGGLGIANIDAEQHEPTTWMSYATETLVLAPGQSVEKPFQIAVPEGTASGQYVNALVLETVKPINPEEGGAFQQFFRKVVSVYITVPGDMQAAFEFGEPTIAVQGTVGAINMPLSNTGNIRIDLTGTMILKNELGDVVSEAPLTLGPVYGRQQTRVQAVIPVLPAAGTYYLEGEFVDSTSGVSASFSEIPVEIPEPDDGVQQPIAFENVVIEANADPIQFANISVDVTVADATFRSTRLTMTVMRDGELVEDFVLADNLALPQGSTSVLQRYLPIAGWESGTYTFSLKLEDTSSGSTELYAESDVASIEVP